MKIYRQRQVNKGKTRTPRFLLEKMDAIKFNTLLLLIIIYTEL